MFWTFTVWINCSSNLKNFANSQPSASNFKFFSQLLEQFFFTVDQNNVGNKIPFLRNHSILCQCFSGQLKVSKFIFNMFFCFDSWKFESTGRHERQYRRRRCRHSGYLAASVAVLPAKNLPWWPWCLCISNKKPSLRIFCQLLLDENNWLLKIWLVKTS